MRLIVKARRNTARYAAGKFRIVHFEWWSKTSNGPRYALRPRVTTAIATRGRRKFRILRHGRMAKGVISKFAFERERYGS
jgi:hypothetical protein